MKVRVERSRGGLAIPIPQELVEDLSLREGSDVDLVATLGRIVLSPEVPTLEELLEGITPENLHGETDWGPAVGKEFW